MAENLKVNAKTKILTFKKKHNLLVDGLNGQTEQEFKIFENIVDKDGHARFIEGDITIDNENVNLIYGKWSLSGTHLMFVMAGNVSFTEDGYYDIEVSLPEWIFNKIYPLVSSIIDNTTYRQFRDTASIISSQLLVSKQTRVIRFRLFCNNPTTYNSFRAVFDLLIDND